MWESFGVFIKQDCFNIHKQINVPQSLLIIKFTYQCTLCSVEFLANDFVSCVSGHPPLIAAIEELTDYDLPKYNYTQSEIYSINMHSYSQGLVFSSNILRAKEDTALFYFYRRHSLFFLLSLIRYLFPVLFLFLIIFLLLLPSLTSAKPRTVWLGTTEGKSEIISVMHKTLSLTPIKCSLRRLQPGTSEELEVVFLVEVIALRDHDK